MVLLGEVLVCGGVYVVVGGVGGVVGGGGCWWGLGFVLLVLWV